MDVDQYLINAGRRVVTASAVDTAGTVGIIFLALILGLSIGSFLTVVSYRLPRGQSIVYPGSHCPNCQCAIQARHNIPVLGWLLLHGRCASCKNSISPRYLIIEACTGLGFVIAAVAVTQGWRPRELVAGAVITTAVCVLSLLLCRHNSVRGQVGR